MQQSRIKLRIEYLFFGLMLLVAVGVATLDTFAQGLDATPASGTPEAATVKRDVLSETEPATAPGELFQLVRYTIPTDLTLEPHTHPGIQMNVIEAGTLTYYVVADGEVIVNRADGTTELLTPGDSTTIGVGDSFIEPAGMVHYGANVSGETVIILTASLLAADEPPSTTAGATPAPDA